jgi:hypothetical protein
MKANAVCVWNLPDNFQALRTNLHKAQIACRIILRGSAFAKQNKP